MPAIYRLLAMCAIAPCLALAFSIAPAEAVHIDTVFALSGNMALASLASVPALERVRGLQSVQATNPNMNPAEIVRNLLDSFEDFKSRYDARAASMEAEIDRLNANASASRVGAGGDIDTAGTRNTLSAFGTFAINGKPDAMRALSPQAAMSTESDPDGGYLVPKEVSSTIVERQRNISPMRRLAAVIQTKSDSYEQLVKTSGSAAAWVAERQARPETDGPKFAAVNVPSHEIYANPSISQKLLDDSAINIGDFLSNDIAQSFDEKEGSSFIDGDGIGKPRGLLTFPIAATADAARPFGTFQYMPTGDASGFKTEDASDCLVDLVYALRAGYRQNASWLMNSTTAAVVRKFKDDNDNFVWQQGLAKGQPSTLLGYPVEIDENMPDVGAGKYPVAFGDFKRGYIITDRIGVRILRDPYTNKPFVMFYTTKRVGGSPLDTSAIKFLKCATS